MFTAHRHSHSHARAGHCDALWFNSHNIYLPKHTHTHRHRHTRTRTRTYTNKYKHTRVYSYAFVGLFYSTFSWGRHFPMVSIGQFSLCFHHFIILIDAIFFLFHSRTWKLNLFWQLVKNPVPTFFIYLFIYSFLFFWIYLFIYLFIYFLSESSFCENRSIADQKSLTPPLFFFFVLSIVSLLKFISVFSQREDRFCSTI